MLRLKIEGNWEPEDFINALTAVESLYYKTQRRLHRYPFDDWYFLHRQPRSASYDEQLDALNAYLLAEGRKRLYGYQRLHLSRVQYASPGKIDFLGIGEAFQSIEGIVDRLITFFTERNLRRERDARAHVDTQIKEVELEKHRTSLASLKIDNARRLFEMSREFPEEFQEILIPLIIKDQEKLIDLIAERKITGVRTKNASE